jgi:transcriptional regulator with XRE-family HTH domain
MTSRRPSQPTTLGQLIRATRERKGISQTELADCAGITRSALSFVETGRTALPREVALKALARCLDLTPGELLDVSGWTGAEVHETELNEAVGRMIANFDEKRREIVNLLPSRLSRVRVPSPAPRKTAQPRGNRDPAELAGSSFWGPV